MSEPEVMGLRRGATTRGEKGRVSDESKSPRSSRPDLLTRRLCREVTAGVCQNVLSLQGLLCENLVWALCRLWTALESFFTVHCSADITVKDISNNRSLLLFLEYCLQKGSKQGEIEAYVVLVCLHLINSFILLYLFLLILYFACSIFVLDLHHLAGNNKYIHNFFKCLVIL